MEKLIMSIVRKLSKNERKSFGKLFLHEFRVYQINITAQDSITLDKSYIKFSKKDFKICSEDYVYYFGVPIFVNISGSIG